jgi:hypothetical protein
VWPRLTEAQVRNSLAEIFGSGLTVPDLDPDLRIEGLPSLGASKVATSPAGVSRYEALAESVARQVMGDPSRRARWVKCAAAAAPDRACAEGFVAAVGRMLFRRPLGAPEIERYLGLWQKLAAATPAPAWSALEHTLAAMLQSPKFLYRLERAADAAAGGRYEPYSMAARLSFLLWNSTPDAALLDAAAAGATASPGGLREHARRLVSAPRAHKALGEFFTALLDVGRLPELALDPKLFPQMTATVGRSMLGETQRVIEDALANGRDYLELVDSPITFVNGELARLYKIQAGAGAEWQRVTLPASGPRAGLLMHAGVLAVSSSPNETSPMLRGKKIREVFLCQPIAEPPANAADVPPPPPGAAPKTRRAALEVHRSSPTCAACHALIDPPGLAFEHFNAIGAARTVDEHGLAIDASGELDGVAFRDARGLAAAVRSHPATAECLVRKLYRHATGRLEDAGDERAIKTAAQGFVRAGHRLDEALIEIAVSDGFTRVGAVRL